MTKKIAVIGAGASGYFYAIELKNALIEYTIDAEVTIFEKTSQALRKVRISGGGRCNVTHNQPDLRLFTRNYPRGNKELLGVLHKFGPNDTVQWFANRGVKIYAQPDGRMFPESDNSQSIINCFQDEAQKLGVEIKFKSQVQSIEYSKNGKFIINSTHDKELVYDKICIATGSDKSGYELVKSLRHKITTLAPSLFTFKVKHPILNDLAGISFKTVELKIKVDKFKHSETSPLLITHWGLSGPAILKASAWGAREFKKLNYQFKFSINFINLNFEQAKNELNTLKKKHSKKHLSSISPFDLPKRFWQNCLNYCIGQEKDEHMLEWSNLSKPQINLLAQCLTQCEFQSIGPHRFKEEFVECGGVDRKEINFKSLESKIIPGLYFTGEVIDVDGITGGFNFQHAWSSAHLAAIACAQTLLSEIH